jgi:small-conductance mechanosensitive channel
MNTKLRPWVIGSVVLAFAATRVAEGENAAVRRAMPEALAHGMIVRTSHVVSYTMLTVATIILFACAVAWVTRTVRTRRARSISPLSCTLTDPAR